MRLRRPGTGRRAIMGAGPSVAIAAAGCSGTASPSAKSGVINAVGAENEYADVLSQIGGRDVHVSILNNPNTDPHTFESSPSVAEEVSVAELIGTERRADTFMNKIESASPNSARKVIVVQNLLGLPDPHNRIPICGTTPRRCLPQPRRWPTTCRLCNRRIPPTSRPT